MAGAFKLPTGEYRFTQEHLSSDGGPRVYIDPSIWCVHGEHEAFDRYIVPRSNITAHLAQIHPFTLGWISDLHSGPRVPDHVKEQIEVLSLCNPTITAFGGDIVSGSGEYLGSGLEDGWFQGVWDYAKDRLSNNLWVKGNHDIDPNRYFYYNWSERLWSFKIGRFKFIGFDGYNEQALCPGSCQPCPSLPDIIWLDRRLQEDDLEKVLLVHQPLDQWCIYCPWVFKRSKEKIVCAYSGHSHDIIYTEGPFEEISGIPNYINGTCSEEVEPKVATLTMFTKEGKERTVLVGGGVEVKGTSDELKITAPSTVGWDKEKVKSTVPIRSVVRTEEHRLNIILLLPSEAVGSVHLRRKGRNVEVLGDAEMYVLGKEIHSKRTPYDSWRCPCGAVWNSYYVAPGDVLVCNLRGGSG